MRSTRTGRFAVATAVLGFSFLSFSHSSYGWEANYLRFEGMGNFAIQDVQNGGHSFAGGARYTPTFATNKNFSLKPFVGGQMFRATNDKNYVVIEYGAMGMFKNFEPVLFNAGIGGGSSLREDAKETRLFVLLGLEYQMNQPLFGFIDRWVANAHYVFNSGDLFFFTYGASVTF